MQHPNYQHLLYFKTIVEEGSISNASQVLRIGKPAISIQLKLLEDFLQKKLFFRNNKKLILTEDGKVVYDYAKEIFKLGSEMINTLEDQHQGLTKIQIGVQDCVPKNLIAKFTSFLYRGNKDASLSIVNGSLEELTIDLLHHKIDVAILNYPPIIQDKNIIMAKKILSSQVVLVGAKNFLDLKNADLKKFNNVPFIFPTIYNGLRHKLEHYFHKNNVDIKIIGEATDSIVQKNMAIAGNGVTAIMIDAVENYIKSKQLFLLKELTGLQDEIWIITAKRKIQNPLAKDLISNFK